MGSPARVMSNVYSLVCPLESLERSSTKIPTSLSGISESTRFTLPHPSSSLGMSRAPMS